MTDQELINIIKEKRKGKKIGVLEQAEMLDSVLEAAQRVADNNLQITQLSKKVAEDKGILADLNMYFPVLYREAKRIFLNPKPKEDVLDTTQISGTSNKKAT